MGENTPDRTKTRAYKEGGAAMSAYAKMQFTEMGAAERERIVKAYFHFTTLYTSVSILLKDIQLIRI